MKRGDEFTHDHIIDPDYKPEPGGTYAGGPKARMVITYVTRLTVYYGYVGSTKSAWALSRPDFERRFGARVGAPGAH